MLKFLHLSDTHVSKSDSKNLPVVERIGYIRVNYPEHRLIVTGDVTDDGDWKQYARVWRILMNCKYYACPGNHDFGLAGNLFDKERARRFDKYLPAAGGRYGRRLKSPVLDIIEEGNTTVALVGINSNIRSRHPFDFARGRIGLWQRFQLERVLWRIRREYPTAMRIVYFHHHPFDRGVFTAMSDSHKLAKVLKGNCELCLFGHKHKAEQWDARAIGVSPIFLAAGKLCEEDTAYEITVNEGGCMDFEIKNVPVIG